MKEPDEMGRGTILHADLDAFYASVEQLLPAPVRRRDRCSMNFTPLVERLSIDEAFAGVAGCERLFGPPVEIANEIHRRARGEIGLPISVGVARTKHLAKIASQVAEPDGLVVVDPATELAFLHDLPVELMWGVGPVKGLAVALLTPAQRLMDVGYLLPVALGE